MVKQKSKYITHDGLLNESEIMSEISVEISDGAGLPAEDKPKYVENCILDFFNRISEDLYINNASKLIPDLISMILHSAKTLGIDKLNMKIDNVADIIDMIKSGGRIAKKNKGRDKRKAVLDAAMIVFSRNGFHETHVDEIAELAGVAKGTVYRYFNSKEDILKEIIKGNNEVLARDLVIIFNKDGHILELIKEAMAYYVNFFDSNKDLYKILTHAPWILKDVSDHLYKNIISQLNVVRRRVFNLTREGVVKPTDFYTVFYGFFGFIDGVIQKWYRRNCEYSLKDELPVIIEVLFYGFVAEGERKDIFI